MPYPNFYDIVYSYTGFQQAQGGNSFPGTQLDNDLRGLRDTSVSLSTFVKTVIRSDGQLNNKIVTYDSLSDVLKLKFGNVGGSTIDLFGVTIEHATLDAPVVHSPTGIVKADVGLGNVDNTSDAAKNAASATLTNKTLTAPVISAPTGIVKADVGLSNVDNTSDATKNAASATLTNKTLTAPVISAPTGIVKADVGLGNVDNTSDANKPVSAAQATAIALKATASPILTDLSAISGAQGDIIYRGASNWVKLAAGTSGQFLKTQGASAVPLWAALPGGGDMLAANNLSDVNAALARGNLGLGNVDNTSDATKNAAVATLTNKTLTAPAMTNPSVTGLITVPQNGGLRDATNGYSGMFFDVATSGAATGAWIWRTTNSFTTFMSLDNTGLTISPLTKGLVVSDASGHLSPYKRTVGDYGATGVGTTAADTAINSAIAATNQVIFPAGQHRISATTGWAANRTYIFEPGASLIIDAGATLTINGPVIAPPHQQIFYATGANSGAGTGIVTGIRQVIVDWWGVAKNGSTPDHVSIQRAFDCVCNSSAGSPAAGRQRIEFLSGVYAVGAQLVISPSNLINVDVIGAGCVTGGSRLLGLTSGSGACMVVYGQTIGSAGTVADFSLSGMSIVNKSQGVGFSTGLQVGVGGTELSGFKQNPISDMYISGFATNVRLSNVRLLMFSRVGVWSADNAGVEAPGSTSVRFEISNANIACGDMDFLDCQFVSPFGDGSTTWPSGIGCDMANAVPGAASGVAGIRFTNCVWYGGQASVNMSCTGGTGAKISDIWFNPGCQMEGQLRGTVLTQAIILSATGVGSKIFNIHVDGCYLSGWGWFKHITGTVASGGLIESIFVRDNYIGNNVKEAIDFRGTGGTCQGIKVLNNQIRASGNSGGDVILFVDATVLDASGNQAIASGGGTTNLVRFAGTFDYITATGNNTGGLMTTSVAGSATHQAIANNI